MNPDSFWSSSIVDVFEMIEGFQHRENESWQRTRFQSYIIYCSVTEESKRVSIYDFLELENDPTPEERQEMAKIEVTKQIDEAVAAYSQAKTLGII